MSLTLFALALNASAYKETVTTTTVPGTAKSVTIAGGATTIECEQSIWTCYTVTITTVENKTIQVGDKVVIEAKDINGTSHQVDL